MKHADKIEVLLLVCMGLYILYSIMEFVLSIRIYIWYI